MPMRSSHGKKNRPGGTTVRGKKQQKFSRRGKGPEQKKVEKLERRGGRRASPSPGPVHWGAWVRGAICVYVGMYMDGGCREARLAGPAGKAGQEGSTAEASCQSSQKNLRPCPCLHARSRAPPSRSPPPPTPLPRSPRTQHLHTPWPSLTESWDPRWIPVSPTFQPSFSRV